MDEPPPGGKMGSNFDPKNTNTRHTRAFDKRFGEIARRVTGIFGNAVQAVKTTVGTTATKLVMPDRRGEFLIRHLDDDPVYIGGNDSITTANDDVYPILKADMLPVLLKGSEDNEIYAVVAAGTVDVYVIGVTKA